MDDGGGDGDGALPYGAQVAASLHRLALSDAADGAGEWCAALAPRGGRRAAALRLALAHAAWLVLLRDVVQSPVLFAAVGEVGSSDARPPYAQGGRCGAGARRAGGAGGAAEGAEHQAAGAPRPQAALRCGRAANCEKGGDRAFRASMRTLALALTPCCAGAGVARGGAAGRGIRAVRRS